MDTTMGRAALPVVAVAVVLAALGSSCGLPAGSDRGGVIEVVAAENIWGGIAAQAAGPGVHVTSLVNNPGTDPHDYEPTPADARAVARADYVIINGAGYDTWATRLATASPDPRRRTLVVADLAGRHQGDNPHMWYAPAVVDSVVARIGADLAGLDPARADQHRVAAATYRDRGLAGYHQAVADLRARHAGTPVGASESIFVDMADALGLRLLTPASFMKAVSEGNDITPADRATVERQLDTHQVRAFVFNRQNATPVVRALVGRARAGGIPVPTVTETPDPGNRPFQDWQTEQLQALAVALGG